MSVNANFRILRKLAEFFERTDAIMHRKVH